VAVSDQKVGPHKPVVVTKEERSIRLPNEFPYPEDSSLEVIPEFSTPAGPIDMTVERPSPETVAQREAERRSMVEEYKNPPECDIKFPPEEREGGESKRRKDKIIPVSTT